MAKAKSTQKTTGEVPTTKEERLKALQTVIEQVEKTYGPGSLDRKSVV